MIALRAAFVYRVVGGVPDHGDPTEFKGCEKTQEQQWRNDGEFKHRRAMTFLSWFWS